MRLEALDARFACRTRVWSSSPRLCFWIPASCFCRNLTLGFFFLQVLAISMVLAPVSLLGPLEDTWNGQLVRLATKSELLSKGEEDPCGCRYTSRHYWTWCTSNVSDPSWSQWARRIWRHEKVDVTSKVLDPPFTNLIQRSDSNEKSMLIKWLSGGGASH